MDTSQAPVREALPELEAVGVFETTRNRGARVRTVDREELREIYGVRAELEAYATELAVQNAMPLLVSELKAIFEKMMVTAHKENFKEFSNLNFRFHNAILEASKNNTLMGMWKDLHVRSRTHVNTHIDPCKSASDLVGIAVSHEAIIDSIETGAPKEARRVAWEHVQANKP
jgi:DNA-binding GntR family transcriptional regulator